MYVSTISHKEGIMFYYLTSQENVVFNVIHFSLAPNTALIISHINDDA